MKHLVLTLASLVVVLLSNSQISQGGSPFSWQTDKINLSELRFNKMASFDEPAMRSEDDFNNATKDVPYRFGKNFDVNLDLTDGEWTDLPNGDRLWNLGIESTGAYSLNFLFSRFYIPEGGKLFIYNEDKTYKIGAFTSDNNTPEKTLPTYPLPGERIIIEYYEPSATAGLIELKIGRVTHGYRDLDVIARGIGDSGACNNNVICSEGDNWRDEIDAVAMIVVGSNGICTGALVNNTANDSHPYFLTADHCTGGGVTNWVFRFNWQSPSCADNNPAQNSVNFQTVTGSTMLAQGSSADYALLEINNGNPIPLAYSPYYAGWDASGVNPTSQVGIHHPAGDLKKISFDNDAAGTATYGGATTWRVFDWEDGTTEGGSSGSPLFDQNHRIIGQLFGGQASCSNNINDYYGKLDVSYPSLCQWLAPGCNTTIVNGFDPDTPASNIDLDVQSISGATDVFCSDAITPTVVVRNAGSSAITSFTLNYDVDGANSQFINWTGSLTSGNSVTLNIGTITGLASGNHTFNAYTSNPNGGTDENTSNDSESSTFSSAVDGSIVALDILTDNYPEENTWEIIDQTDGSTVISGGPYVGDQTNFIENICLPNGCYELIFYDSYGDGMQYQGVVGNYILTDTSGNTLAEIISGGNFGAQANHPFCVADTPLSASFTSDTQNICSNSSVQFTDTSIGGPTNWNWTFSGGTPGSSTDSNPSVFYASPGVYDVTLTAGNGASNDTETITGFITVIVNTFYYDGDSDGYGDDNITIQACTAPSNFVSAGGDCAPLISTIYPGSIEICDGIDNNCDGQIDEGFTLITYYEDIDGDGYGSSNSISACSPQGAYNVTITGDCDDMDLNINPNSSEICGNGIDDNCNNQIDENLITFYTDSDLDGFGDLASPILSCSAASGIVSNSLDCDDTNENRYPNAPGTMEGLDNDCDGDIEGDELLPPLCPGDFDNNNMVNINDLLMVLELFGCDTGDCIIDMNDDGDTTIVDLGLFLSFFGSTCN